MPKDTIEIWRRRFDAIHGEGAAAEFERLLVDQSVTFKAIGERFGFSVQRVSQIVEKHFPMFTRRVAGNVKSRAANRRKT